MSRKTESGFLFTVAAVIAFIGAIGVLLELNKQKAEREHWERVEAAITPASAPSAPKP